MGIFQENLKLFIAFKIMKRFLVFLLWASQALAISPAVNPVNGGTFVGAGVPRNNFHFGPVKDFTFTLSVQPVTRVTIPGTVTSGVAVLDTIVSRQVETTTVQDFQVVAKPSPINRSIEIITITSSNTGHVSNPVNGLMSYVNNGSANIQANSATYSISHAVTAATQGGQTFDTLTSYATGSLTKHIRDTFDTRLAGKTPDIGLNIYSARSDPTAEYTRNPDLWANDVDWTCVSVWNSTGGVNMAGTLISPRHIIFAAHYQISTGATLRFVSADGTVVTRTLLAKLQAPNYSPYYPDWVVGLLDSDVPAGISFAKILPDGWGAKLKSVQGTPAAGFNQFKELLAREASNLSSSVDVGRAYFQKPAGGQRLAFYKDVIGGDSGSPAFFIINNHPVLITTWTFGDAGGGTSIQAQRGPINTAMHTLSVNASASTDYQLADEDLSGFTNY